MIQVGITGGIGSGKTTVCKIFESLGVPIFYADAEAKKLLTNQDLKHDIVKAFGQEVLTRNEIDRKKLAQIVFNDENALKILNSLIHPKVGLAYEEWVKEQKHPFVLKEAAILFESGSHKNLDKVIYVSAPESLRIERVCLRDGVTEEQVKIRINNQWAEEKKLELSQFVIVNDDKTLVIPQVLKLYKEFMS